MTENCPQLRGLNLTQSEVWERIASRTPYLLTVLTPGRCNLRCPYCFTSGWRSDTEVMARRDYLGLLEEARRSGFEAVWWVGAGEPFLVPWWPDVVDTCRDVGLWLGVFTNGTSLDDDGSRLIVRNNVSVYVKLNSFDPCVQGQLTGSDGTRFLGKVILRINSFVGAGMADDRRLAIESVITKLNYDEIPNLYRWCRDRGIVPFIEMMEHANPAAVELDVSRKEHVLLFRELQRIDHDEYGYDWDLAPPWAGRRCRNVYLGLAVDACGNVTPCSGMRYILGNLRDRSLAEIWNSENARAFRDPRRLEPKPWDGTSLGGYGCKSHAYHVTGDPLAVDPRSKWFDADSGDEDGK